MERTCWRRLGYRVQKVALGVVLFSGRVFCVLRSGFRRRRSKVVPYLILLVHIDLDLLLVLVGLASMELGPDKSGRELITLSWNLLDRALGVDLLLGFLRCRHRNGVG